MPRPANAKNCKTCVICTGKWTARMYAKYRKTFAQLNPKRSTNPNCHLTEVQELFLINNCFDYEGKLSLFCYKHFIDFSGVGTKKYRKLKTAAGQRFENPRYQKQKRVRGANDSPGPLDLSGDGENLEDSDALLNGLSSGEKQSRKRKSNNNGNHDLETIARLAAGTIQDAHDSDDDEDDDQEKHGLSGGLPPSASYFPLPGMSTAMSMAHLSHLGAQAMNANGMAARYNFQNMGLPSNASSTTTTQSMSGNSGDVTDVNQQLMGGLNPMNPMNPMPPQMTGMNQMGQMNQMNAMNQMNTMGQLSSMNPINQTSLVGAQHL